MRVLDMYFKKSNLAIFSIVFSSILLSACGDNLLPNSNMSKEDAYSEIKKFEKSVNPSYRENNVRANIKLSKTNLLSMLPNLDDYPIQGNQRDSSTVEVVEIFTSSEKGGTDRDGLFVDMAENFNRMGQKTSNGKQAYIAIRKIASGLGAQFIISQNYVPDAFSPSNNLWGEMLNANGVKTETIAEATAKNTAGIVVKKSKMDMITENGKLDMSKLLTVVSSGDFAMGYTNPYQSSTGLNFLITVLNAFSDGDESQMLSPDVASSFETFQGGVPYVAQTTLQMRDETGNSGVLDGYVMEKQSYINLKGMNDYQFIPFGVRHDSPLYATPEADESEREVLKLFAQFLETQNKQLKNYGFDQTPEYKSAYQIKDNNIIGEAQKLWKQRKSGGKPIAAIFVADVSGSMEGIRIKNLKRALIDSSDLISSKNAIGLITYNDRVNVDLSIRPYNVQQKSLFIGAVERLSAGGKTATIDATVTAMSELIKFDEKNPGYKKIIFVLSDGERTAGLDYDKVKEAFEWSAIPIHTIAYELDSPEMKAMSGLAEGAYIKSTSSSASYRIGNLLNSEM